MASTNNNNCKVEEEKKQSGYDEDVDVMSLIPQLSQSCVVSEQSPAEFVTVTPKDDTSNHDRFCYNEGCNNTTALKFCNDCYVRHQAQLPECEKIDCHNKANNKYCRRCKMAHRAQHHRCELCREVVCSRKYCDDCFEGLGTCQWTNEKGEFICKSSNRKTAFKYCWHHHVLSNTLSQSKNLKKKGRKSTKSYS